MELKSHNKEPYQIGIFGSNRTFMELKYIYFNKP